MSFCVVTGYGPRVGTSFVMQKAKEKNLPIYGEKFINGITVEKHNPNGYWEINPFFLQEILEGKVKSKILKIWPDLLSFIDPSKISCIVILQRLNKKQQIKSINKVLKDELKLPTNKLFYTGETAEEMIIKQSNLLNKYLINCTNKLNVYTENLSSEINNILEFLERGLKWEQ